MAEKGGLFWANGAGMGMNPVKPLASARF